MFPRADAAPAGALEILSDVLSPTAVAVGYMTSALAGLNPIRKIFAAQQRDANLCLVAEVSDLICPGMEGRGFSPAAELTRDLGVLAPEATRLQGLKAHSALSPEAAGLKPRPSEGHK